MIYVGHAPLRFTGYGFPLLRLPNGGFELLRQVYPIPNFRLGSKGSFSHHTNFERAFDLFDQLTLLASMFAILDRFANLVHHLFRISITFLNYRRCFVFVAASMFAILARFRQKCCHFFRFLHLLHVVAGYQSRVLTFARTLVMKHDSTFTRVSSYQEALARTNRRVNSTVNIHM